MIAEDLLRFIENPLINSQKKSKVLIKLYHQNLYHTQKLFRVLLKFFLNTENSLFEKVFLKFNNIIDQDDGITEIFITTANPLETKTEQKIKKETF